MTPFVLLLVAVCVFALIGTSAGQSANLRHGVKAVEKAAEAADHRDAVSPESKANNVEILSRGKGPGKKDEVTRAEVEKALEDWGKGLISVATAKKDNEDYVAVARDMINKAYNYEAGIVLFKPTLAAAIPFRTTYEGALAYFVGGNADFPEDTGFAIKNWKSVGFEIVGVVADTNRALVQTKTTFTKTDDSIVVAYFSMAFTRDSKKDKLKIDLHHSSVPPV